MVVLRVLLVPHAENDSDFNTQSYDVGGLVSAIGRAGKSLWQFGNTLGDFGSSGHGGQDLDS